MNQFFERNSQLQFHLTDAKLKVFYKEKYDLTHISGKTLEVFYSKNVLIEMKRSLSSEAVFSILQKFRMEGSFKFLANHGIPWRHNKIVHHYDRQKCGCSGDRKKEHHLVF